MDDTKVCTACHTEKPVTDFNRWKWSHDGHQVWCRLCQKVERETHKEQYKERRTKYYKGHKEQNFRQAKAWCAANPEKRKESYTASRWRNIEKVRVGACVSKKKHYEKNKPKFYAASSRWRARRKGAKGSISPVEWTEILRYFNHQCAYCMKAFSSTNLPTQDHMTPLGQDGDHSVENIVPACRSCNSQKQRRSLEQWADIRGDQPVHPNLVGWILNSPPSDRVSVQAC